MEERVPSVPSVPPFICRDVNEPVLFPHEANPKKRGRPKLLNKDDEQIRQRKKEVALKHYYDNWEYKRFQQKLYNERNIEVILEKQRIRRAKAKEERANKE